MSIHRTGRTEAPALPATATATALGTLPLGSVASRAAARTRLLQRKDSERRRDVVFVVDTPGAATKVGELKKGEDGIWHRSIWMSYDHRLADVLAEAGGFSPEELAAIAIKQPERFTHFEIVQINR